MRLSYTVKEPGCGLAGCFLLFFFVMILGALAFEITRIVLIIEFFKWLLNL